MASENESRDVDESAADGVMGLLSEHVPLSLIVDLSSPTGPDSEDILTSEGGPEDSWWVQPGAEAGGRDAEGEDAEH